MHNNKRWIYIERASHRIVHLYIYIYIYIDYVVLHTKKEFIYLYVLENSNIMLEK